MLGLTAADRRRHAVSQLWRIGDGGQLRRARHAGQRARRSDIDRNRPSPFTKPTRYLAATLARRRRWCSSRCILNVQLVHADDYVVQAACRFSGRRRAAVPVQPARPRCGRADSARHHLRSQRSSARDRRRRVARARERNTRSWASLLNATCAEPIERCYPLGGAAFHLLGDCARPASNWSATNSSYIERDAEDALARLRRSRHGRRIARRCRRIRRRRFGAIIGELVPLLRHRHDPDHPAVLAFLDRKRDLQLTIDARLQLARRGNPRDGGARIDHG